jgi:hypothetical protein
MGELSTFRVQNQSAAIIFRMSKNRMVKTLEIFKIRCYQGIIIRSELYLYPNQGVVHTNWSNLSDQSFWIFT